MKQHRRTIEFDPDAIARICRSYHVETLSLFGSAARGEARPQSDLDFIVDFEPGSHTTLLTLIGLQNALEDLFGPSLPIMSETLGLR